MSIKSTPIFLQLLLTQINVTNMSVLATSKAFMAEADNPPCETFHKFFECWIREQNMYLEELVSAANNHNQNQNQNQNQNENDNETILVPLIERVIQHYEQYYQAKSTWEAQDPISMFTPTWRSRLEDAYLWIGGWRPTLAIHLLYSKSGVQMDARIGELLDGLLTTTGRDLGGLSPDQVEQIDKLQRKTIREERVLSEKLAKQQESMADRSMVELSNVVSEMIRNDQNQNIIINNQGGENHDERVESTLDSKEDGMEELLHKADDLRLDTLKAVIRILTPIQAVYFLIAAAELHLRLHEWGKQRDNNASGTHDNNNNNHATPLHVVA